MVSKNKPFFRDRGRLAVPLEFLEGRSMLFEISVSENVLEFLASNHCVWLYTVVSTRALKEALLPSLPLQKNAVMRSVSIKVIQV